ncbi:DMT family transporter [Amorphoplanes nipponensis]|uniref:Membrane protein n=1 Tax=Actinoplanes nipponensis TaxID=135950 RepID=A0A919MMM6_9ACTN|nr:DMT family transporter [Actinoplanes nipponensis]GIE50706.1 membrane protein [Actinoplanes nipponensis]
MSRLLPLAAGSAAMTCVGGSVAVSAEIAGAPLFTVQSLRYALACLLLLGLAALTRYRPVRPRGAEWLWLTGIAATGLVLFNLALVQGARHAEPAVLGVAVACVPVLLAAIGPLLEGRGPAPSVLAGAVVVTAGAGLVQGVGRADGAGLAWAAVAFGCEAAFTLLAVPVLGRHGPVGVSVHTTWLAAAMLAVLGVLHEGPAAALRLTGPDLLAGAYLAVAVTAVAFVLWYACVSRIGAGRAGLLTGIAPIAAALAGVALGGPAPRPLVWVGIAVVALGLAVGLRTSPPDPGPTPDPGPPAARPADAAPPGPVLAAVAGGRVIA